MLATFHNHSTWSDGKNTLAELCSAAEPKGVEILGVSDHFCVYPDGASPNWSLPPNRAAEYLGDFATLRPSAKLELIVGLEFDWFEHHSTVLKSMVEKIPLDYRIGSVHHVDGAQFDVDPTYWTSKTVEERDAVYVRYWRLILEMAESGLFDIAAHLDLPKKLGYPPSRDLTPFIAEALDAIEAHRLVVELNTAGFGQRCADGYPSAEILAMCKARGIQVTLSADAHKSDHLLFEFTRGLQCLNDAGFTQIARFRERAVWLEPLDSAAPRPPCIPSRATKETQ